jgi:hypothetical protein
MAVSSYWLMLRQQLDFQWRPFCGKVEWSQPQDATHVYYAFIIPIKADATGTGKMMG